MEHNMNNLIDINIGNEILIPIILFFAEYPNRPKCIKFFFDKYDILKWIFVYLFFSARKNTLIYFIIIYLTYNIFYAIDCIMPYVHDDYDDYIDNTIRPEFLNH